ncbi:MAG: SDR family oxidoreductase [Gammaproteobacteria bacterium]
MSVKLKKLSEQVIVITGATSGIGLTTARMAAAKGARLVLAARGEEALQQLADELKASGKEAIAVKADVGNPEEVKRVADAAIAHFGRIDTWVNNAGISIFGKLEDVPLDDQRRLFETNFWGVVHGSMEAVRHLRQNGGALINLGSELSDHAAPLQGAYSASKHAVKGFTDSLRMELEHDKLPVSVTLVKPAGIDTMFAVHAKNYMEEEPALPSPIYAPELVAQSILYAAEHPKRDVFVGGAAKLNSASNYHAPALTDALMSRMMFSQQKSGIPADKSRRDALYEPVPSTELRQRQGMDKHVAEHCPYTAVSMRSNPWMAALVGGGALFAAWRLVRGPSPLARRLGV